MITIIIIIISNIAIINCLISLIFLSLAANLLLYLQQLQAF